MTGPLLIVGIACVLGLVVVTGLRAARREHLWPAVLLIVAAPLEVYRADAGPGNLSVFRVALVIALAGVLLTHRTRLREVRVPVPVLLYGVLLVLQVLSIGLVSENRGLGTRFLLQYLAGLSAVAVIAACARRRDLPALTGALAASAVLPALASVWRVLVSTEPGARTLPGLSLLDIDPQIAAARESGSFLLEGVQRLQGTFSDPNHFAFFAAGVCLALVGLLGQLGMSAPRPRPALLIALALAALTALLLVLGSYSRSAWLLLFLGALGFAALAGPDARRAYLRGRALLAVGALVLAGVAVAVPVLLARLDAEASSAVSNRTHLETMELAVELTRDNPVTGVGLGSYGGYAGQPELVSSAHSAILTTAAELGIPGLLLLLGVMASTLIAGVRSLRAERGAGRLTAAALVGGFGGMAVANLVYEVWIDDFMWVFFALVLVATRQPSVPLVPRRAAKVAA